ncbi:MAG: DNA internalization-related competence protein ComEC/Rec2 [Lachnospiraceae bacterium]|nr:DNA internalization-related competence protein ComEC/Rec2 [Lachnospiraceae bacterium]
MKRPLLWAVVSFALGEVISLNADSFIKISIIFIMLICGAFIAAGRLGVFKTSYAALLCLCAFMGILNVYMRDPEQRYEYKQNQESVINVSEYGTVYKLMENGNEYDIYIRLDNGINVASFCVTYELRFGDRVYVDGVLKKFSHSTNSGCFDFKNYYKTKNILYSVDNNYISFVSNNDDYRYRFLNFLFNIKQNSEINLSLITDKKISGIYCAILMGDRKAVDEYTRLDYQNNGIAHILAISGLHIALIFALIYKLLRKIHINRLVAGILGFLILFSYSVMTGFSMSTLRALCMIVISLIAEYTGENYDIPISLSTAVLIILLYNPFKIMDTSVLLSVTAMAGVCVGQYILKHIKYFYYINTRKKKFFASLIISSSVSIVMLPVIINTYHEITPYSVFFNLIVIPLMTVVVFSGIAAILISFLSVPAARLIIRPGALVLRLYDYVCGFLYKLPLSRINIGRVYLYQIVIYYTLIFLLLLMLNKKITRIIRERIYKRFHVWCSFKMWRRLCILYVLFLLIVGFGGFAYTYKRSLGELIVFLDVGQGDGILLRSESGVNMLIDGGSTTEDELGKYVMLPAIKYYGMAHIDYWFISHTDTDHISGLLYILRLGERSGVRIDNLVFSYAMEDETAFAELTALAEKNEINVMFMETGDYVTDESFELMCTHPDRTYETADINDSSLCLSYISDDCSALFTGDMGNDALSYMLMNECEYLLSDYDILKVPHHGSRNSLDVEFYDKIYFETAVISCGENNSYGHPHKEVLEMLDKLGVEIRRTDKEGEVVVE